jgi:carbonic anhydrase
VDPGDAHVIRTAGGVVTDDEIRGFVCEGESGRLREVT